MLNEIFENPFLEGLTSTNDENGVPHTMQKRRNDGVFMSRSFVVEMHVRKYTDRSLRWGWREVLILAIGKLGGLSCVEDLSVFLNNTYNDVYLLLTSSVRPRT
jgi:hypothetical protein